MTTTATHEFDFDPADVPPLDCITLHDCIAERPYLHIRMLRHWADRGYVRAWKLGHEVVVSRREFDAYLASRLRKKRLADPVDTDDQGADA